MGVGEFKNRIGFIRDFADKMDKETVPWATQRILIKIYASTLRINLTEKMIGDII